MKQVKPADIAPGGLNLTESNSGSGKLWILLNVDEILQIFRYPNQFQVVDGERHIGQLDFLFIKLSHDKIL